MFLDTACMSVQMTFKELFDHLGIYIRDPDQRWKHVMRVKCDLEDCSGYGGSGKDQAYFAGTRVPHMFFYIQGSCVKDLSTSSGLQ